MPDPISWAIAWPYLVESLIIGYLLGSIPFGLLLTRAAGLGDIRSIGSGNIGTTNVLRTGKKSLAAATLLGDALKGTAAVLIVYHWAGIDHAIVAGLGAFLGHLFPIWLKFKGGKGVATYIGIILGLYWPGALIFCAIWIYVAVFTRYSSFSALTASLATPFILAGLGHWQLAELFTLLTVLIWAKHHANISRLIKGTESRIGAK
ncbi:glycerol-3-phosphate 1-O-acyltransferase PlsY [Breoghania sp.]|uniref:glycerol-3-phosphate 1-O-acyltransferase PlsY n=1 Tax=Breoghania sp. TaxID=2065378 RepID=UPI002AA73D81|nr:glycerol-3-phosphate 1-O-acyltransferase PlsY [Breoghania sp.]